MLEGLTLTAIFQAVPVFASAVLMLKLTGSREIVGEPGGAAIFVVLASLISAPITVYFGPKFPKFFKNGYEPLFFDCDAAVRRKNPALADAADGVAAAGDLGDAVLAAVGGCREHAVSLSTAKDLAVIPGRP